MSEIAPPRESWGRALWAGLLSLFQPGLGQVYAGAWQQGMTLFAIGIVLYVAMGAVTRLATPEPAAVITFLAVGVVGLLLYRLLVAIAAIRLVRRGMPPASTRRWHRSTWIAALAMVAIAVAASRLLAPNDTDLLGWRSFRIASGSGLPTLVPGDRVMVDVNPPQTLPAYGAVVVFHNPRYSGMAWVDRAVGLPGDRVQMRGGALYLNGNRIARTAIVGQPGQYRETLPNGRSYTILEKTDNGPADNTAEFLVPPDSFFVLADNRDDAIDSRMLDHVGFVPRANLIGTVYTVFWSSDLSRLFLRIR